MKLPFNNPIKAVVFIILFIITWIGFRACEVNAAETKIEVGVAALRGNVNGAGSALLLTEIWDKKWGLGLGIVSDQFVDGENQSNNMFIHAKRFVNYKIMNLGLGVAYWQNTNAGLGSNFTFALSLGANIWKNLDLNFHHFSNAGTASPNGGEDMLTLSWRFQ